MRIDYQCVECLEFMNFELEVEPYGWLTCPKCKKKVCIIFNSDRK